ncbi:Ribonuclease II, chloroplastic/mitochondrial [Vitis vinifera]|uniref:Ribonuclease II, chloroplastic/mitochondrial n=1 Tax=Vitis vinifera TaxID=29760 RepID=A0A438DE84_VITVI|nr:Ribonuclease II, chloroplastic/mitochondrial [Vitis vinifera]
MDLLAHYQVKAFLRGDSPPFSAGQMEGMAATVNMHARLAKRLCSSSLRYWILEFIRRQPKEKKFRALVLRFIKDRIAALLLMEVRHVMVVLGNPDLSIPYYRISDKSVLQILQVGLQASAWVSLGNRLEMKLKLRWKKPHPRDDVLSLKEVT